MSNRRSFGSMGGNRGNTNRNFYHQPFQSNINPWQSGGMNQGSGSGFLPQLTTNSQQLALALTTLLQPQVQAPQPLMSMNSSSMNRGSNSDRFGNRGRDIRRHEPYNKNRSNFNKRKPNRNQQNRKKDDKKKNDKKDAKKDKSDTDQSMDEEDKKGDQKKSAKDDDDKSDKEGEKSVKRNKEGKFYKIPVQFLTCFVCNKQMRDGESMENHLKGRAHSEMITSLEESIGITVKILKENMRLREEYNRIELFRMRRNKKVSKAIRQNMHCNMCDLDFKGMMSRHRRGEGHQRLKKYNHPTCTKCDVEFKSRIEWVKHRLTPEHLRKHIIYPQELGENNPGPSDDSEAVIDLEEEGSQELDIGKLLQEPTGENENPILELDDNLENLQNRYPAYKRDRPVSTKSIKEFSGFVCKLCNQSFTEEANAKKHLMSKVHYYKFMKAIKQKLKRRAKKAKQEREAKKKATKDVEKAENGVGEEQNGEVEEKADEEMDETLNDSAMETADESLNESQEDIAMNDSQESEVVEDEGENDDVEVVPETAGEENGDGEKTPAAKTAPAPKIAAAAATPTKPAPPAATKATPPAARGRKARK